jgi:Na+/phosphate symporter
MRSNFSYIEGTFIDLQRRIAAYDHALDRTRIETPGVSLAAAEGSLNHLRDRAAALHYELSQSYQVNARHAHEYRPDGRVYPYEKRLQRRIEKRYGTPPPTDFDRGYERVPDPAAPPFK